MKKYIKMITKKRLAIACIWSTFKFGHVKLSNVLQIWSFYKCKKKSNLNNFPISTNFKIWTIFSHKLSLHFNNFHCYTLLNCRHFPKFNFTTTIKRSEKKWVRETYIQTTYAKDFFFGIFKFCHHLEIIQIHIS